MTSDSGKVFVFSGILPICNDEHGLAAVLGHEIAHYVAHHQAESMSRFYVLIAGAWLLSFAVNLSDFWTRFVLEYGFMRPSSRKQEVSLPSSSSHGRRSMLTVC